MPVRAVTYTDDMQSIKSDNITTYENLMVRVFRGNAYGIPDPTALTISSTPAMLAHVTYRLQDAEEVSASIYSHVGTFVTQNPDNPSEHFMGIFQDSMDFLTGRRLVQASFSRAAGHVYADADGLKQMYHSGKAYVFGPVQDQPDVTGLIGYGINFYYSLDGVDYTRIIDARHSELSYNPGVFVLETYTAPFPQNAKYLRVEINDVNAVYLNGELTQKESAAITALASVTISGEDLTLGEPEQPVAVPPSIFSPAPKKSSSSAKQDRLSSESEKSSKASSTPSSKPEKEYVPVLKNEPVKSSGSTSKFEGTITVSSKPAKSKASSKSKSEASSLSSSAKAEAPSPSEPQRDEVVIHEFPSKSEDGGIPDKVIGGGIIVSSALILLYIFTHPAPRP